MNLRIFDLDALDQVFLLDRVQRLRASLIEKGELLRGVRDRFWGSKGAPLEWKAYKMERRPLPGLCLRSGRYARRGGYSGT